MLKTALTLSQTTNFRPFQTERGSRRQFQIWWKWKKVIEMGGKHCGKRRNCSLRAISPFPTVFSKELYCRHVKTRACLGKGLKTIQSINQPVGLPENSRKSVHFIHVRDLSLLIVNLDRELFMTVYFESSINLNTIIFNGFRYWKIASCEFASTVCFKTCYLCPLSTSIALVTGGLNSSLWWIWLYRIKHYYEHRSIKSIKIVKFSSESWAGRIRWHSVHLTKAGVRETDTRFPKARISS